MFPNLSKSKNLLLGSALVAAASAGFLGCQLDPYIITAEEQYTRNFIKDFGLIDPNQDWNLAKEATVSINLGDAVHKSVKIYAKTQDKYYLVADLTDISGRLDVPVDVPKSTTDFMVVTNGRKYYGGLAAPIDCSDMSRGVPGVEYNDDGTANNPNPAVYTKTDEKTGYGITVKHTNKGNGKGTIYEKYNDNGAYQYFNTQQISPLISTTPWDTYYSENTKKWTENPGNPKWVGLLPESGVFNRLKSELTTWIDAKKAEGHSIVEDFRITTGDDGSFTLFPYYYGTNLKHELGVYLLDDNNNPILKSGTYDSANPGQYKLEDFVSFPVFQDRAPGDLQVQPHYDSAITGIRLKYENPEFELGENFDLQSQVEIERNGTWISYNDYIAQYGSEYHSRVAYHFWVDEPTDDMAQRPDSFARIYNNGIVTPLKLTKDHNKEGIAYAKVAIPTGLDKSVTFGAGVGQIGGAQLDFTYKVVSPGTASHQLTWECRGNTEAITLAKWQEYFEISDEYKEDVTAGLFMGDDKDHGKFTKGADAWGTLKLDSEVFKDADNTYKLRIKMDSQHALGIRAGGWDPALSYEYISNGNKYNSAGDGNCITTNEATEYDILLSDDVLNVIQNKGIAFQEKSGSHVTFLKVELVRPIKDGEEVMYNWTTTGKQEVTDYLTKYYTGKAGIEKCDYCSKKFDFSDITPIVTIDINAGYDKILYTVTWKIQGGETSVRSRSVLSREYFDETTTKAFLNPGKASDWKDVNSYWSRFLPHQEEVASYPPNVCMLARSRGYDVTITYGTDEQGNPMPWKGNLGMYLKVLGSYDEVEKHDEEWTSKWYEEEYTDYSTIGKEYVVFSQNRFNKDAQGNRTDQISALSVKHPMSGRTFLTFEDMRVTRNGITPADFKEKSSDRDVNDLIFNISNYGGISNDKESITETSEKDETISWLWAVEDLGATDDFDFNDMVMKITSVTKNRIATTTDKDAQGNESTSTTTTMMYKKVTFQPLCAGGTLPLYVQYTKDDKTYTLKPGVFKEEGLNYEGSEFKGASEISEIQRKGDAADDASEIHRWFGDGGYPSTMMINTQGGSIKAKSCVLYLKDGFSIAGFGSGSLKGPQGGLTVYVKDDRTQQNYSDITDGDEGWVISTPDPGKVSQMFMIYDANTKWRWPIERTHILNAYPKFKEWVNRPSDNAEWFKGGVKKCTVPRYDLGEIE